MFDHETPVIAPAHLMPPSLVGRGRSVTGAAKADAVSAVAPVQSAISQLATAMQSMTASPSEHDWSEIQSMWSKASPKIQAMNDPAASAKASALDSAISSALDNPTDKSEVTYTQKAANDLVQAVQSSKAAGALSYTDGQSYAGVAKADVLPHASALDQSISALDDSKPISADVLQPIAAAWSDIHDGAKQTGDNKVTLAALMLNNAIAAAQADPGRPGRVTAMQMSSSNLVQTLNTGASAGFSTQEHPMFGEHGSTTDYDKAAPVIGPSRLMPSTWGAGDRNAEFASAGADKAPKPVGPSAIELKQSQFNPQTKQVWVDGKWQDPVVLEAQGHDYVVRLNNGKIFSATDPNFPIKIVDQSDYDPATDSIKGFLGIGWNTVQKINEGVWVKLHNGTVVSPDQISQTVTAVAGAAPWSEAGEEPDNSVMMRWYRQQVQSQQRQKAINDATYSNGAGFAGAAVKTVVDPEAAAALKEPVNGLFPLEEYLKALALHGNDSAIVGTSHIVVSPEGQADVPITVHIIVDTDLKGNITDLWEELRANKSTTVEDRDPTQADLVSLAKRTIVNVMTGLLTEDKTKGAVMAPLSPIVAEMAAAGREACGEEPDNSVMMRWYRQQTQSQARQKAINDATYSN